MKATARIGVAAAIAAAALAGTAAVAGAAEGGAGRERPVFVQNDNLSGNQVVVYDRANDGSLSRAGTYDTGGHGGALAGSVVDHLASQGSLEYDRANGLLYAVNAGSDTISVFGVSGDRLSLRQVLSSGGSFPVSIAFSGRTVYALNALGGGSVQGFSLSGGRLVAIAGSNRPLGLDPGATPQFVNTPGQVAFSPDGGRLIITTKANGSSIDVFGVESDGRLSLSPVVNPEPGTVPFGVTFDRQGHLVVAEAGTNALASFTLAQNGRLSQLDTAETGQGATCWVVSTGGRFYASNAASASLSGFRSTLGGESLTFTGNVETDPGTVDATVTGEGRFLYVQAGAEGTVDEFAVGGQDQLTPIGSVAVPGAVGGEGIASL